MTPPKRCGMGDMALTSPAYCQGDLSPSLHTALGLGRHTFTTFRLFVTIVTWSSNDRSLMFTLLTTEDGHHVAIQSWRNTTQEVISNPSKMHKGSGTRSNKTNDSKKQHSQRTSDIILYEKYSHFIFQLFLGTFYALSGPPGRPFDRPLTRAEEALSTS